MIFAKQVAVEDDGGARAEQRQAGRSDLTLVPLVQDDEDHGHVVAGVSLADGVVRQALCEK